jgi:hypothetical protein
MNLETTKRFALDSPGEAIAQRLGLRRDAVVPYAHNAVGEAPCACQEDRQRATAEAVWTDREYCGSKRYDVHKVTCQDVGQ